MSERLLRISDGSGVANNTNNANNEQGNEIARYAYDPFGRGIKKTVSQNPSGQGSTGTTLYFYADEGLIAEVDGNAGSTTLGNITTSYGWVPNNTWGTAPQWKRDHAGQSGATNPQGDASTNGVEHYYHVDHLGTSQRLTNAQGETTWRMVSEAFGKTFVDTTLAPTTTGTTTNNLRFPGQYEDVETGTYYNYMRTYLPMVGRYGESDPVGLGGGVNTFSYVEGNPLMLFDFFGLNSSDKWYGYNNPNFRDWVHQWKQDAGLPKGYNFTQAEICALNDEYNDEYKSKGSPRGKGGKSGKGGQSREDKMKEWQRYMRSGGKGGGRGND
ncbi:hypothetical protein AEM42_08310 [Betaproteobacteria bacterium UKL13-2]|nr:hypothetical protein AEM42_08310 [Betaproteobacteria bacterium UKL13-2]